ncbi:MAG TPA: gluconokinase [Burkholderiaceae bacterium]|nr:gluconokinase [Burkholderiaceae bacterium]
MIEHPVVVMGVAGCGKSSLGGALAEAVGALLIEGDVWHSAASRDKMRRGVPLTDADRASWLDALAGELRARGANVVLTCSALKRSYRDRLRAVAPDLRFIFMEIDPESARARIEARDAHFFSPTLVASQFDALESPLGEPGVLRVDALAPLAKLRAEVSTWLQTGRGGAADDLGN